MSVVPAVAVAVSGNARIDAHQRLGELHRRAAVVLTQLGEAGLTRPKDALRSVVVDELIYIKGEQLKCCCMVCEHARWKWSMVRSSQHCFPPKQGRKEAPSSNASSCSEPQG